MDPVSMIAAAVAMGAAAGLKDTASRAIGDAYVAFKALLKRRYGTVDVAPVEAKPDSNAKRASLAEDLSSAGAAADHELLKLASDVVEAVAANHPQAAQSIGIDLEEVRGTSLRIRNVKAGGVGVKVRKGEFTEGIDIQDVEANFKSDPKT